MNTLRWCAVVAIVLLLWVLGRHTVLGQTETRDPGSQTKVYVTYLSAGGVSLEELASGAQGEGAILYSIDEDFQHPQLVVALSKHAAGPATAKVYDTPANLGYVPVTVMAGDVQVAPELLPSVTVQTVDGWWVRGSVISFNLDVEIRGPIDAMWGAAYDPQRGALGWTESVGQDEATVSIRIRDNESDGIPDWDFRSLLPRFRGMGYYRTNYAERKCSSPLAVGQGVTPLWPYVALDGAYEQEPGMLRPPIVVDWTVGRITHVSELVTVRNQNCSYALYSIDPVMPDEHNHPDFETPFAFYDLSGEGAGYPNLILRTERAFAGDQGGQVDELKSIRYSWRNSVGDWLWDYKIDVLGTHPYTFTTAIAGNRMTIDAPPYDEFPRWVVDKPWPVVTFVEPEGAMLRSSEGIYEWSSAMVGEEYAWGVEDRPSPDAFTTISEGFRGEYRLSQALPPRLYLSPIDNRLHLLGAEGGLWNVPGPTLLSVADLNGDRYIDSWLLENEPIGAGDTEGAGDAHTGSQALYALNGYLLYVSANRVLVRRTDYELALFELSPPSDAASWQSFRRHLDRYAGQRRDAPDLAGWAEQFAGATLAIDGAHIRDLRPLADGFRFVLELQPGYEVEQAGLLPLQARPPGEYVVRFDGELTMHAITPPALSLHGDNPAEALLGKEPVPIGVVAHNTGLADARCLSLVIDRETGAAVDPRRRQHEPSLLPFVFTLIGTAGQQLIAAMVLLLFALLIGAAMYGDRRLWGEDDQ